MVVRRCGQAERRGEPPSIHSIMIDYQDRLPHKSFFKLSLLMSNLSFFFFPGLRVPQRADLYWEFQDSLRRALKEPATF